MSYGPVLANFTPLGQIADSFFNARDKAIDRQWKQAQLTAPGEWAGLQAAAAGQGGQPPANAQLGMVPLGQIGQGQYGSYNGQGKAPTFAAIGGTPTTPELKPNDAARVAFNTLVSGGLTPGQASGFLGNFAEESSFNPQAYNDKENAIGFAQWRGPRADALKQFAAANGASPFDPAIQAKFALQEMSTDPQYRSAWQQLQVAKTPQEAAAAVISWEKPGGWKPGDPTGVPSYNDRLGHAARVAQTFGGQGANPADEPAPGAQPAQFVIPGSGQSVPASGQPAQSGVTAPRIPIPAYVIQGLHYPNPGVQALAAQALQKIQEQQRQLDVEAWKIRAQHDINQPNADRTYGLQLNQFGHTVENDDRNYGLNVDKFGHEKEKDAQDLSLRRDQFGHTVENDNTVNQIRGREVTTQEAAQRLREQAQSFDQSQQINGPIQKQIVEDLGKGKTQAVGAVDTLTALDRQEAALNAGMFVGAGADAKQNIARYLGTLLPGLNDKVAAGQEYGAAVQREVGALARQLAQTGHTTNMDINVSKMISAADPEYTEQAIRKIIQANRAQAQVVIDRHNANVSDYAQRNPTAANLTNSFRVDPPKPVDDAVTAEKNASTGADLGPLPKGDQRAPIPSGYTASRVLSEASKAYATASQDPNPTTRQQKINAILKRVHGFGIDPSRIVN